MRLELVRTESLVEMTPSPYENRDNMTRTRIQAAF